MKPTVKAPGIRRMKLRYDGPLSNFALKFNLRRYNWPCCRRQYCRLLLLPLSLGRGSHSFPFLLNLSDFYGIGGARGDRAASVQGVLWGV